MRGKIFAGGDFVRWGEKLGASRYNFLKRRTRAGFEPFRACYIATDPERHGIQWHRGVSEYPLGEVTSMVRLKTGAGKLRPLATRSARRVFRPTVRALPSWFVLKVLEYTF